MVSKAWDLDVCAGCALLVLCTAVLGSVPWVLRTAIALPLVVVVAGWALTAALHPGRDLPFKERLTTAIALSLALAVIGGVVLNTTPWGLRPVPWAIWEAGLTLLFTGFALHGGYSRSRPAGATLLRVRTRDQLLFGSAALLVVLALSVARFSWNAHQGVPFTALSMVPNAWQNASAVYLSVENEENRPETYEVRLQQGATTLQDWQTITLLQGQTWHSSLQLAGIFDPKIEMDALLYRSDAPDVPYRTVTLVPKR